MKNEFKGFTLIEVLVSMILISFASIFLMKCMITSLNGIKNSNIRFRVINAIEIKKNRLMGQDFKSPHLSAGKTKESSGNVHVSTTIKDISSGLKKVTLAGMSEKYRIISVFHISESIREGKNE